MQFNQPNTIATDPEVEAQITALRVQIADKEAEINRLDTIIRSNKYAIEQLANEKAELEGKLPELRIQKNTLEKDILQTVAQHEKSLKNLDEITVEAKNLRLEVSTNKELLENMEAKIKKESEELKKGQEKLENDRKKLQSDQEAIHTKLEQLRSIIN